MGLLLLICAIVGVASLLGGALSGLAKVLVTLLKYVVGPATILLIIIYCLKCGL